MTSLACARLVRRLHLNGSIVGIAVECSAGLLVEGVAATGASALLRVAEEVGAGETPAAR
jgi:hypothetical protein